MRTRFHVVVANWCRAASFVSNIGALSGLDPARDSIIFLDCSPPEVRPRELASLRSLADLGFSPGKNVNIVERESRNLSHGAQLDYLTLLLDGRLSSPQFIFFMQEHYLDRANYVREDTLPDGISLNLNDIEAEFESSPEVGCCYATRNGIRVSVSTPAAHAAMFGDSEALVPGAKERCFFVDGGNFAVRPERYLTWLSRNRRMVASGSGGYGSAFVWEVRLGKIIYDQRLVWIDLVRKARFTEIEELRELEKLRAEQLSRLWYDNRVWFFIFGRDIEWYLPIPFLPALRGLFNEAAAYVSSSRSARRMSPVLHEPEPPR